MPILKKLRGRLAGRAAALPVAFRPGPATGAVAPDGTVLWTHAPQAGLAAVPPLAVPAGFELGDGVRVFHDGDPARVSLSAAPGALFRVAAGESGAKYLSLAIALPETGCRPPDDGSLLGLLTELAAAAPLSPTVRLNLRSGPNHETRLRPAVWHGGHARADFDLAPLLGRPAPLTSGWFDLILSPVPAAAVEIRSLLILHRRRASL